MTEITTTADSLLESLALNLADCPDINGKVWTLRNQLIAQSVGRDEVEQDELITLWLKPEIERITTDWQTVRDQKSQEYFAHIEEMRKWVNLLREAWYSDEQLSRYRNFCSLNGCEPETGDLERWYVTQKEDAKRYGGKAPTADQVFRKLETSHKAAEHREAFSKYPQTVKGDIVWLDLTSLRCGRVVLIDKRMLRWMRPLGGLLTFERRQLMYWTGHEEIALGRKISTRIKRPVSEYVEAVWNEISDEHQKALQIWEQHDKGVRRPLIATKCASTLQAVNDVLDSPRVNKDDHLSAYQSDDGLRTAANTHVSREETWPLDLLFIRPLSDEELISKALAEELAKPAEVPTDPVAITNECETLLHELLKKVPALVNRDGGNKVLSCPQDCHDTIGAVWNHIKGNCQTGATVEILLEMRALDRALKAADPKPPYQDRSNTMRCDPESLQALGDYGLDENGERVGDTLAQKQRYAIGMAPAGDVDSRGARVKASYKGLGSGSNEEHEGADRYIAGYVRSGGDNVSVPDDDDQESTVKSDDRVKVIDETKPMRIIDELAPEEQGEANA
jgi:hypothetical protein